MSAASLVGSLQMRISIFSPSALTASVVTSFRVAILRGSDLAQRDGLLAAVIYGDRAQMAFQLFLDGIESVGRLVETAQRRKPAPLTADKLADR